MTRTPEKDDDPLRRRLLKVALDAQAGADSAFELLKEYDDCQSKKAANEEVDE